MFIINFYLNMFRVLLCPSSGEQRPCYCLWCTALVLLDVVGSGCGALRCRMRAVLASYNTICSNTVLVLLKMGIMMPEHVETEVDNKHLIAASCWFFLSLHTSTPLLGLHGLF